MITRRTFLAAFAIVWAAIGCAVLDAGAEERVVYHARSQYNNDIYVTESDGLRVLRFERHGARQSVVRMGDPDHLELGYAKVMPVALALVERPRRVMVIGLGGGTLPMFLRARLPELGIDVVELDPGVVEVARTQFDYREDAKLRTFVDDGRRFVERTAERYDIIMVDAFGADFIPYPLVTREFHAAVRRALAPGGIVIANIWARWSNALYDSMVKTYAELYESSALIEVANTGNRIVIGAPWRPFPGKGELIERSARVTRVLPLRDDLARLIDWGWRPIAKEAGDGRVLTDAGRPK